MDHLRHGNWPLRINVRVPYIGTEEYDGMSFSNYPQRKGWDKAWLFEHSSYGGRTLEQTAAFLQTWLYFGVLSEVLEIKVDEREFIRDKEITTQELPRYLGDWKNREINLAPNDKIRRQIKIDLCLDEVRIILAEYRRIQYPSPYPEIELSIMVLVEVLDRAKRMILGVSETFELTGWSQEAQKGWGHSTLLEEQMLHSKWCPTTLAMLRHSLGSVSVMYYAHGLEPPHSKSSPNHSKCKGRFCMAEQVDESTYKTRHVEGCLSRRKCLHIGPKLEELEDALSKDSFPLLSTSKEQTVQVVKYRPGMKYVAFSHVWAHGLGNPRRNTLPKCQLLRLQSFVNKIFFKRAGSLFWIDTLCIPVGNEELRRLAIKKMYQTYSAADKVLVLDTDILKCSRKADYFERVMKITSSSWMRRLWTLQEATLAKDLYFQLSDGAMNIKDIETKYENDPESSSLYNPLPETAKQFATTLRILWNSSPEDLITILWKAMQWRATSRISDVSIVLATSFDLDVTDILNVTDPEGRLKSFLKKLDSLPAGLIFVGGRRMTEPGFRWAQNSWMSGQAVAYPDTLLLGGPKGRLTETGLQVTYPGFRIRFASTSVGPRFWLPSTKYLSTWYCITYIADSEDAGPADEWDRISDIFKHGEPAIILSRPHPGETPEIGVLVAIKETLNDRFHAEYLCRVRVSLEGNLQCIRRFKEIFLVSGTPWLEELPPTQRWCLG